MPAKGQTGFNHSPETRKKISEALKLAYKENRHVSPFIKMWEDGTLKGFQGKHTEETKAKISKNRKGKCLGNTNRKGHTPWNKGKPHNVHTEEWREKVSQANSGENHWNWKGGIDAENRLMRNSSKHKEWMKSVFQRDSWTCKNCGLRGQKGQIVAHHIIPWHLNKPLRFEVSNGITLCRSCHCAIHKPRTGTGKPPKPHST